MYWRTIPHTMFDFIDFYTSIANQLPNNARIAEVGVADGASAIYLGETLRELKKDFSMRMIDSLDYGKMYQLNVLYTNVYNAGLNKEIEIVPVDSLNASLRYPDQFFDFVFIDTGHTFELTKAEVRLWFHKVKHGGILAGHDTHLTDVTYAVRETISEYEEIETKNGWGVWKITKTPSIVLK